jgi:hypothetical protein
MAISPFKEIVANISFFLGMSLVIAIWLLLPPFAGQFYVIKTTLSLRLKLRLKDADP